MAHKFIRLLSFLFLDIIHYLYLPLCILTMNNMIDIYENHKISRYNLPFAFHINSIYLSKAQYKFNKNEVIKININRCNTFLFSRLISHSSKIKFNKKKVIPFYNAKQIIDYLRVSGFLKSMEVLNYNPNYRILNIDISPIIKRVYIYRYQNLNIPENLLLNLFKNQLGLPKNYYLIEKILNKICSWYKSKGFLWANVQLVNSSKLDSNSISLNISEGIIFKTKLACEDKKLLRMTHLNNLNNLIVKELKISPGEILNLYNLKCGISKLKKFKILQECSYCIDFCKRGIIISINYKTIKSGGIYFHSYKSNLMQSKSNINFIRVIMNNSRNLIDKIFPFLNPSINTIKIQSFLFYYDFFYGKKYVKHFITITRISKSDNEIHLLLNFPIINKNDIIEGDFTFNSLLYSFKPVIYTEDISINLPYFNKAYTRTANFYIFLHKSKVRFQKKFCNFFSLESSLLFIKKTNSKVSLNIQTHITPSIEKMFKASIYNIYKDQPKFHLKKTLKNAKIKWITFKILLDVQMHKYFNFIKIKQDINISSFLFVLTSNKKKNNLNLIIDLKKSINYRFKLVIPNQFLTLSTGKNDFTILGELNFILSEEDLMFPNKYNFRYMNSENSKIYNFNNPTIGSSCFFTIQYKVYLSKLISFYLFSKFTTFSSYVANKLINANFNDQSQYELITFGLRFKLKTPIKKIPIIYLKIGLHNNNKTLITINTVYKYR